MVLRRNGRVLLLKRSPTMAFAPGMHVFPGGGVADIDLRSEDPLRACAVRETFEEVAIEVAHCVLFDRWITPEVEERRYDVSFYLADVESEGRLSTTEADELLWIEPAAAAAAHDRGLCPMLRPTYIVLEQLSNGRITEDPSRVVPKLPRARADGLWDVIDARSGQVLLTTTAGPTIAEVDGRVMETGK